MTEEQKPASDSGSGEIKALEQGADNQPGAESAAQPAEKKSDGSGSSPLRWLLVLLLLGLVAAAGFWGWQQLEAQKSVNNELRAELDNLQGVSQSAKTQAGQLVSSVESRQQELELQLREVQRNLNAQGARIVELGGASRSDWLLAEADYLVRLANQRLYTERSTENPVALLLEADAILRELNDSELLPVRQALAQDITALRMAGKVDREGIYLELQALTQAIAKLSLLRDIELPEARAVASSEAAPEDAGWRDRLRAMWARSGEALSKLVDFRRNQQPIEPLLPEADEAVVRHNLRLMMEQAQLSLLREEQAIYGASLERSAQWLRQYFQLNPQANVVVERLAELGESNVVQQLPDISGSSQALENVIKLRHARHAPGEPAAVEASEDSAEAEQ